MYVYIYIYIYINSPQEDAEAALQREHPTKLVAGRMSLEMRSPQRTISIMA